VVIDELAVNRPVRSVRQNLGECIGDNALVDDS